MINIALLLILLTCAGMISAWIAENPGSVTIHWYDYQIDTSFGFLLLVALISIVLLSYAYSLLRRLLCAPDYFYNKRRLKNYERGITELTCSVAALASSDMKEAELHTRNAEKYLGTTPLTLLLSAQVARSQGNDSKTQALLEQMLEHKETEYVAARSLSDSASKNNPAAALTLAQRAYAINPAGVPKLVSLHIKQQQWHTALEAIDNAKRKGKITRSDMRHLKAMVYAAQATLSEDKSAGLVAARFAFKYAPDFSPVVALVARAYANQQQQDKAISLIAKRWKDHADNVLASAFIDIIAHEPKDKQLKLTQKYIAARADTREGHLLLAQVALSQREWEIARKSIVAAHAMLETVRSCTLMAELEQGQWSDFDAKGRWLARSSSAMADPAWVCTSCSNESTAWHTHCQKCDSFDTLSWKQRDLKFVG
jgi:HemY protein